MQSTGDQFRRRRSPLQSDQHDSIRAYCKESRPAEVFRITLMHMTDIHLKTQLRRHCATCENYDRFSAAYPTSYPAFS
jgi:hypothetical protein